MTPPIDTTHHIPPVPVPDGGTGEEVGGPSTEAPSGDVTEEAHPEAAQELSALEGRGVDGNPPAIHVQLTSPEDGSAIDTANLEHVGTVIVGDTRASLDQNSPETVSATDESIRSTGEPIRTADISVSVEIPWRIEQESHGGSLPSHYTMSYPSRTHFSEGFGTVSYRSAERPSFAPSSAPPASMRHRYVLNVFDVHDMGGTPSSIQILDASGNPVHSPIFLGEGNSQYAVDLPEGDYTFRAISGIRPDENAPDALDNFRLEIYDGGTAEPSGNESGSTEEGQGQEPAPAGDAS